MQAMCCRLAACVMEETACCRLAACVMQLQLSHGPPVAGQTDVTIIR